jgi:hypothetical protein
MRHWIILIIFICLLFPETGMSDIYYWIGEQGIENYSARIESSPEGYRSKAQMLFLSAAPPAPPELKPGNGQADT